MYLPLGAFTLGAVQFEADTEIYTDAQHFEREIESYLDLCNNADMVIFPEYTSAFTASFIAENSTFSEVLRTSEEVRSYLDNFWGNQAKDRGLWILAGTYLEGREGLLFNTALLYSPEGDCVLNQRKCFLGDPEKLYGLSAGSMEDVTTFQVEDIEMALTICRDTYNSQWDNHFDRADIWVDIKANELPYSNEYYSGALPSRLPQSPVNRGLTVSLVGEFLGYSFEGLTLLHQEKEILLATYSHNKGTVLLFPLEPEK